MIIDSPAIPLSLPQNAGIAFVPESGASATNRPKRKEKMDLMERISSEFRAPGTRHIRASSTLVNLSEQLRNDSLDGLQLAATDLVENFRAELERFRQKVKEMPESCLIQHKQGYGYTGGGSLGAGCSVTLLFLPSPDLARYGGLAGLAFGAVAYYCLCKGLQSERHRMIWLLILAGTGLKIIVETATRAPVFAHVQSTPCHVLSSVHLTGFLGAMVTIALNWGKNLPENHKP